jgi:hypothetical protein
MKSAFLVLSLMIVGTACGTGDGLLAPAAYEGTYSLQIVNGLPLPQPLVNDPWYRLEVTAGTLTLKRGYAFTVRYDTRVTEWEEVHIGYSTATGTYAVRDGKLVQRFSTGESLESEMVNAEIREPNFAHIWVRSR